MPTELFTIKPLEWDRLKGNPAWAANPLPTIQYQVGWVGGEPAFRWCVRNSGKFQDCASPQEGKRLAEAHWQNYIKQALVPVEENNNEVRN